MACREKKKREEGAISLFLFEITPPLSLFPRLHSISMALEHEQSLETPLHLGVRAKWVNATARHEIKSET